MSLHDQEALLTQEWRAIVLDKLRTLEAGQKDIQNQVTDLRMSRAPSECLEELAERVRILEDFRLKIVTQSVTAMALVQAAVTIAWLLISKLL